MNPVLGRLLSPVLLAGLIAGTTASVFADSLVPFVSAYPVPGSPYQVSVQAPGQVWVTLPAQNAIAGLTVTSPGVYDVISYSVPTADSQPYDIAYAAGSVWVTERIGNKIGRFDPLTGSWTEYLVPTADSQPTGINVVPGNPIEIWFTERAGNKLGRLRVSDTGSSAFDEYALPVANAYPESVVARASEPIWFTAPGISRFAQFMPSSWPASGAFRFQPTGDGSQPWDMKLALDGLPWFTEPNGNRIGKWAPGTITLITWYGLPVSNSMPYSLDVTQEYVWFTERDGNRVGQLQPLTGSMRELALPGAAPTGIAVDASGCAWVAASSLNSVISWCSPYFQFAFLPLIRKGK